MQQNLKGNSVGGGPDRDGGGPSLSIYVFIKKPRVNSAESSEKVKESKRHRIEKARWGVDRGEDRQCSLVYSGRRTHSCL